MENRSEKKEDDVFSAFKSDGFVFKNADIGQIETPESIKFTSIDEGSALGNNKRRIVKPRRNLNPSAQQKLTTSLSMLHLNADEDSEFTRTFIPTWKIILYLEQIVTNLGFELYPMDIFMEIRKRYHAMNSPVTAENAIVSTIDLNSISVTLKSPSGLLIESENDKGFFRLLVAEYGKHVISRVSIDNLTQKVSYEIIAGRPGILGGSDGPAHDALFQQPISMCKDWDDNLLIVDCSGHKIRKLDAKTGLISTFAGSVTGLEDGPLLQAKFQHPSDICLHKDNLYIVDSGNSQIRIINKKDLVVKTLTFRSIEHDNNQGLSKPRSLCINSEGDIFVTDFGNSKVKKLSKVLPNSPEAKEFGAIEYKLSTVLRAQFKQPYGICLDNEGNLIVSDWENSNIRKLDISGSRVKHTCIAGKIAGFGDGKGGTVDTTRFQGPCGVKIDSIGNIYIADYLNHMIRKISNETLISKTDIANSSSKLSIYYEKTRPAFKQAIFHNG